MQSVITAQIALLCSAGAAVAYIFLRKGKRLDNNTSQQIIFISVILFPLICAAILVRMP